MSAEIPARPALPNRQSQNITTYRGRVVLFTSFYEMRGYAPYISSIVPTIAVLERLGISWDYRTIAGDFHFERALNAALSAVRDSETDTDIIVIDADEAWEPEAVLRLLSHDVDIVCCSYKMKGAWDKFVAVPKQDENGNYLGRILPDGTALLEALRVTGGFIRFTRKALRAYSEAYPELHYKQDGRDCCAYFMSAIEDGTFWSHDYLLSERWRRLGLQLWIDPNPTVWHYGMRGHEGNLDRHLREQAALHDAAKAIPLTEQEEAAFRAMQEIAA